MGSKKDFVLTHHARTALAKRRIPVSWVERALTSPEATEADLLDSTLEHHLLRIPEFGNRVLRVIVNKQSRPWRVFTAFFDRRRKIS
jgi:hypothetical protein